jgi:polyphosphate kinase 2 (PPK2 family)
MNYSKRFIVEPGAKVKLHKIDPGYTDPDLTEKDALAETKKLCKKLRKLQASLYSEKQRSLLVVLQALDTAGKDGVINHVLGAMNPLSCRVASVQKTRTGGGGAQLLVAGEHFPAREGRDRDL